MGSEGELIDPWHVCVCWMDWVTNQPSIHPSIYRSLEQVVDIQRSREWVIDTRGKWVKRREQASIREEGSRAVSLWTSPHNHHRTGGGSVAWGDRGQGKATTVASSPPSTSNKQRRAGAEREEGEGRGAGEEDAEPCSILPGGVLWSDHGGNSQDLVIVTERGVDIYKARLLVSSKGEGGGEVGWLMEGRGGT